VRACARAMALFGDQRACMGLVGAQSSTELEPSPNSGLLLMRA